MTSLRPEPQLPASRQHADATIWSPPSPPGPGQRVAWTALAGSAPAAAVAAAARHRGGLTLLVAADTAAARRWIEELSFYDAGLEALIFPDWETLPYDAFSPHEDIVAERLATLHQLPRWQDQHAGPGVLVVPMRTLMQRVVPRSFVDGNAIRLAVGDRYDIALERDQLLAAGYAAVETVSGPGEFAVRGSLMDIYPVGSGTAVRVDLLDDDIESLRLFDAETQRTIERIERLELLPAKEYPLNAESIARFRDCWHHTFDVDVRRVSLYQDISQRIPPSGVEYYLPFFFDDLETLFDFVPAECLTVVDGAAFDHGERFHADVLDRYENLRHDVERPILPPDSLFLPPDEVRGRLNRHPQVHLNGTGRHQIAFATRPLPDLEARPRQKEPASAVVDFVRQVDRPVLFVADTAGRREVLQEFLARAGLRPKEVDDLEDFRSAGEPLAIALATLDRGLLVDELAVVTESEIFGHQVAERRARSNRVLDPDQIIKNLTELHIGDPVVHIDHGIGRYQGLQTLTIDGSPNEFLTLVYADDAKLYVPVTSLHLISRYAGAEHEHAPLHRLGSDQWEKAKRKAREKIYDVAAELLNI